MVTLIIDNDDDFWFQKPWAENAMPPERYSNKKALQHWLECNMMHLQVNYCAMHDGSISDFACWGNRTKSVLEMFDQLYYQLSVQDGGLINSGNWSIKWSDDSIEPS